MVEVAVQTSHIPLPLSGPIDTSLPAPVPVAGAPLPRATNDPRRARVRTPISDALPAAPAGETPALTEPAADV
jgi:hypothetical protein